MKPYEIHLINSSNLKNPSKIITFGNNSTTDRKNVIKSKQMIHNDDTIKDVKYKLVKELNSVSTKELYLFYETNDYFNVEKVFEQMTDTDINEITSNKMMGLVKKNLTDDTILSGVSRQNGSINVDISNFDERVDYYKMLDNVHHDSYDFLFTINPFQLDDLETNDNIEFNDVAILQTREGDHWLMRNLKIMVLMISQI